LYMKWVVHVCFFQLKK